MSAPRGSARLRPLAAALLLVALARPAAAHEIGAGRLDVLLQPDGAVRLDLAFDPEVTLQRLELAAGETPTPGLPLAALQDHLTARRAALLARLAVSADGRPLPLAFRYLETPPPRGGRLEAVLRLEGRARPGAALRLRWSLPASRFALTLRHATAPASAVETCWLEPGETSPPLRARGAAQERLAVAAQYVGLGFTHILPQGLDHILFVLGIFLFAQRLRPVLAQVTAFTLAHSITLGLALYGVVALPSRVVEPLIALSIVYVAVENVLRPRLTPWRVAVVFAFGLLHGLGFAGALRELGLPRSRFLLALVTFNVGVELGQLAVLALAFLLVASWARQADWYRGRVVVPGSLAIAAVGLYWTVARVLS